MNRQRGKLSLTIEGGPRVLAEILGGGQTFLWEPLSPERWQGVIGELPFRVELTRDGLLLWTCLGSAEASAKQIVERFFAVETPFADLVDQLPWRSDSVLAAALADFPGLRILRQPPETALLAFLLSPLKRIPQIRAGLVEISRRWGSPLADSLYAPPGWGRIAQIAEEDLRSCGIGYRARSIHRTARFLANQPGFLQNLEKLSTHEARQALLILPGVGRKIADCVLLFGYGRLEAFPIDTWISRTVKSSYGLDGFSDEQVQQFAAAHYGLNAGLAQQFLFAKARNTTGSVRREDFGQTRHEN